MTYPWPNPNALRDLVYSRLLPVRQTIGQFLASYPTAKLTAGLREVTVTHCPRMRAEAKVITGWLQRRLTACDAEELTFAEEVGPAGKLAVTFVYDDDAHYFRWLGNFETGQAHFECDFGSGATKLSASVSLLTPDRALSEAMFF